MLHTKLGTRSEATLPVNLSTAAWFTINNPPCGGAICCPFCNTTNEDTP